MGFTKDKNIIDNFQNNHSKEEIINNLLKNVYYGSGGKMNDSYPNQKNRTSDDFGSREFDFAHLVLVGDKKHKAGGDVYGTEFSAEVWDDTKWHFELENAAYLYLITHDYGTNSTAERTRFEYALTILAIENYDLAMETAQAISNTRYNNLLGIKGTKDLLKQNNIVDLVSGKEPNKELNIPREKYYVDLDATVEKCMGKLYPELFEKENKKDTQKVHQDPEMKGFFKEKYNTKITYENSMEKKHTDLLGNDGKEYVNGCREMYEKLTDELNPWYHKNSSAYKNLLTTLKDLQRIVKYEKPLLERHVDEAKRRITNAAQLYVSMIGTNHKGNRVTSLGQGRFEAAAVLIRLGSDEKADSLKLYMDTAYPEGNDANKMINKIEEKVTAMHNAYGVKGNKFKALLENKKVIDIDDLRRGLDNQKQEFSQKLANTKTFDANEFARLKAVSFYCSKVVNDIKYIKVETLEKNIQEIANSKAMKALTFKSGYSKQDYQQLSDAFDNIVKGKSVEFHEKQEEKALEADNTGLENKNNVPKKEEQKNDDYVLDALNLS